MAAYKATGYGNNSTAQLVFGVLFSEALSALVKYYAFDNDQTFPQTDTVETVANDVLAGTAGNGNLSMVSLIDTTNAAPSSDWKPAGATAGEANPNRMKGQTSYVEQDGSLRGSLERITFNMVVEVPSDATTAMAFGFDLKIVYSYTGAAPTVTWQINTGSEGTPSWQDIAPDTYGILHCRAGSGPSGQGGDGNYYANIPESGTEDTAEAWADTSTIPA